MLTSLIVLIISITGIGVVAYFTNKLFGCQSSGMGPLPPHYKHLMPTDEPDEQPNNTRSAKAEERT